MPDSPDKPVVLISGADGLIGKALAPVLWDRYQVVGLDRHPCRQPPRQLENVLFDVTDADSVRRALDRVKYAYGDRLAAFVHLAAYYDFSGAPSDLYEQVTVDGTARVLDALDGGGFDVGLFVFSSTMLVHKPTAPGEPITEDSPLEAKWDYPASKIKTEAVIRAHHGRFPAAMLRIAGVYTDECDSIPIAHQIQRIYERQITSHVYPADVTHGQAFVHLADTADALARAVDRRDAFPRDPTPVLIGEPDTYSYDELQKELGRLLHGEADWKTARVPKAVAEAGAWVQQKADVLPGVDEPFIKPWMIPLADDHYELDISRARAMLGWEPSRRLLATLPTMVAALKADPAAWYKHHNLGEPPKA